MQAKTKKNISKNKLFAQIRPILAKYCNICTINIVIQQPFKPESQNARKGKKETIQGKKKRKVYYNNILDV